MVDLRHDQTGERPSVINPREGNDTMAPELSKRLAVGRTCFRLLGLTAVNA